MNWWPKPSWAISPLLCARLGWRCVPTPTGSSAHHVDSLLCVRCGATLSVRLPIVRDSDSLAARIHILYFDHQVLLLLSWLFFPNLVRKAAKEVRHQLLEAHNPSCTWRSLHTPSILFLLSLTLTLVLIFSPIFYFYIEFSSIVYTPQRSLSEKSTATDYFKSNAKANFQLLLMLDCHSLPILHSDFLDEVAHHHLLYSVGILVSIFVLFNIRMTSYVYYLYAL